MHFLLLLLLYVEGRPTFGSPDAAGYDRASAPSTSCA
jgi:hypothetical protein